MFFFSIDGVGSKKFRWVLSEELPRLAEELNRIESIRSYLRESLSDKLFFSVINLFHEIIT
jgi:hypothetical protein